MGSAGPGAAAILPSWKVHAERRFDMRASLRAAATHLLIALGLGTAACAPAHAEDPALGTLADPRIIRPEPPPSRVVIARARLLTASCAACHGTNGYSVGITPTLAGLGHDYFRRQMLDFKSGARPGTVMNRHAEAYTYEEIETMAAFFSSLPRRDCPSSRTAAETRHADR